MKQVLLSKNGVSVADVPAPGAGRGEVLVKVLRSCISVGTEMSSVRSAAVPMWKRAVRDPDKVVATVKRVAASGLRNTWRFIEQKSEQDIAIGYSAAGFVVQVGEDVDDILVGDRVACAGGGYAFHAEYVAVPRNLCSPIPEGLDWDSSSTVTLGAIALQGVRRASPTMGETFVVIGLGILGQITAQLLKSSGCRCIGLDTDSERVDLAKSLGMEMSLCSEADIEQVARVTDGLGADGVIITAASASHEIVSRAFKVCRKKGRVVLVGDVGLNLNREDFYVKEIDLLISTSYGPGRYDHNYEERGLDYPASYVRWTENRNMAEYLRLLSSKDVVVKPLVSSTYPISAATAAYEALGDSETRPLLVLLTYSEDKEGIERSVPLDPLVSRKSGQIRVALIGAGAFACTTHIPNLMRLPSRFALHAVVGRTGYKAASVAKRYGARYASTDASRVLEDADVDAVIVATRHDLHAELALAALRAGKHVLVEKPLALNCSELRALDEFVTQDREHTIPLLMTGYNRRFSPFAKRIFELLETRSGPFMISYRMNAGYVERDHWVHGPEGGGRNVGEACHIYDLFTFLANSEVSDLSAHAVAPASHYYSGRDNFAATLRFSDGSVATLVYTGLGNGAYPKEMADVYWDGKIVVMEDYKRLDGFGVGVGSSRLRVQEKGFLEELTAFADGIDNGEWPIPWWHQRQVAQVALRIDVALSARSSDWSET